jgi:CHAD domain-containing protein
MAHATTGFRVALAAVIRAQCAAVSAAWPRAVRGDADAIHRVRTASRRLRETLPVVAAAVPDSDADRVRRDARRLTRALGVVRELDVALEVLGDGAGGRTWTGPDAVRVRRVLTTARAREGRAMRAKLRVLNRNDWRTRTEALIASLADATTARVPETVLAQRLRRRAAGLRRTVAAAGTLYAPEALHRVRIAAKKLRYSLELTRDIAGAPVAALIVSLVDVQSRLGRIHDLHVLDQRVRSMPWPERRREALQSRAAIEAALESECREQHAAFLARRADVLAVARHAGSALAASLTVPRRRPIRMKLTSRPARAAKSAVGLR